MTTAAAVQAAAHNGKRLDAIDATLQGQHLLRHVVSLADLLRAREHFERALAIEPDSASALTGLAQSQLSEFEAGWNIGVQGIALAEKTIARALAADPDYLPAQCLMVMYCANAATSKVRYACIKRSWPPIRATPGAMHASG